MGSKRTVSTCPSGKVRYSTEVGAKIALAKVRWEDRNECRHYRCPSCHGWHLSSRRRPANA